MSNNQVILYVVVYAVIMVVAIAFFIPLLTEFFKPALMLLLEGRPEWLLDPSVVLTILGVVVFILIGFGVWIGSQTTGRARH